MMRRRAMLTKLKDLPRARAALPFVRMSYGALSTYLWQDDEGRTHTVEQGEGGEQGDPLMPAQYSLGQHAALEAVQRQLQEGEHLFAFLDDVYVLCQPERVRVLFDLLRR